MDPTEFGTMDEATDIFQEYAEELAELVALDPNALPAPVPMPLVSEADIPF